MAPRASISDPIPPDGWIARDALVAATGVGDRNLLNWCAGGLVPRPMRFFLGGGRGTAAFYRAESIEMIRRLEELRRQGRDADAWFWGLWFDAADYPVDIQSWTLRRLDRALKTIDAIGNDQDQINRKVVDALNTRNPTHKLRRQGTKPADLHALALWAYRVAADIEQQERLDNSGSPILHTLRQVAGLPEQGFPVPDRELGVELMAAAWFREVVETASPGELEQVRRDCRAIDRVATIAERIDWHTALPAIQSATRLVTGELPEPPSIRARKEARKRAPVPDIVRFLGSFWADLDMRAFLIPGLIVIRKSPEHDKRLTEILALAATAFELFPRLPGCGDGGDDSNAR